MSHRRPLHNPILLIGLDVTQELSMLGLELHQRGESALMLVELLDVGMHTSQSGANNSTELIE